MIDETIKSEQFQNVIACWKNLKRLDGHSIPPKSSINPKDMLGFIKYIAITEYLGPKELMVRLSGTGVDRVLKRNTTGQNVFDYYASDDVDLYQGLYEKIINEPVGAVMRRSGVSTEKGPHNVNSIILPLCDDDGAVKYLLSYYDFVPIAKDIMVDDYPDFKKFNSLEFKFLDLETEALFD